MKSVVSDLSGYDWSGDRHPRRSFAQTVVYEMHVGGFTKNPNSGVDPQKRGTYSGLIEKIPYLTDLGITAVELLPVFQFDAQDAPNGVNYWGYSPVSFFAPHQGYGTGRDPLKVLDEFRDMVKALHKAGIEVFWMWFTTILQKLAHQALYFVLRELITASIISLRMIKRNIQTIQVQEIQ